MAETELGEVKDAIVDLAMIINTIATLCREALGTAWVNNIGRRCEAIVDRLESW